MRIIVIFFLSITVSTQVCYASKKKLKKPKRGIQFVYSKAADYFEIIDRAGFREYEEDGIRSSWKAELNLESKGIELLRRYQKLRLKYKPSNSEFDYKLFFPNPKLVKSDPIALSFYYSKSLDEAWKRLESHIAPAELTFMKELFEYFSPKISKMISGNIIFESSIKDINKQFKKDVGTQYFNKLAKFLRLKINFPIPILLLWQPSASEGQYAVNSGAILARIHSSQFNRDEILEKVTPKLATLLFAYQPKGQMEGLSKQFLNSCALEKYMDEQQLFVWPMMITAGQIVSKAFKKRRKFNPIGDFGADSWTRLYSRQLFPLLHYYLDNRLTITDSFMKYAGELCSDIDRAFLLLQLNKAEKTFRKSDGRP